MARTEAPAEGENCREKLLPANLSVFIMVALIFLSACSRMHERTEYGEIAKGQHLEGLIVNSDALHHRSGDSPMWTPPRELVLSIEPGLIAYVRSFRDKSEANKLIADHLYEYKLQYLGYNVDNKKTIEITFSHLSMVKNGEWKVPFGVLGGGINFFHLVYDVDTKTFDGLVINADA